MTIEQLVCITIGFVVQGATFVLGILVGLSMRKDSHREIEDQRQGLAGSEQVGRKLQQELPPPFPVGSTEDQGAGTEWQAGEALGATGSEAARAVNDENGRRIVMAEEIERLRDGAVEGCETVCPHVRGTVTQHCALNFTLTDEEREAIEWFAEVRKPLTRLTQSHNREKYKDTLCGLLERLK